jgi:class 3 adenylate cyclase/predicted ATPase
MTVMFCDLVESTPLAELFDPEDFREVLSGYQHACARAIERFNGYTAKYVGDGLVAYFGYPRAHEDDALRAVHAGLGILEEVESLNAGLRDVSLQVRIGLDTGIVVAGQMGAGEMREHLAIVGETPHIAARLESIAQPGSVMISDATRALVEDYFETKPQGVTALRGVSRTVGVHKVLRPSALVERLEVAAARRLRPMVGRGRELARLTEAWQQAEDGHGATVHVSGEAGIGKSRLVIGLREQVGQRIRVERRWQCSAHHRNTSLYPVIRFLERLLGLDRRETFRHQLEVLKRAVLAAGLDPVEAVPLLGDLLSVRGGHRDARAGLTPRDARTATLRVLEALLVTNPAEHPMLLLVEDLQWADPTTVELIGRLVPRLPGIPVLCILTFRREFKPPWSQPVLEMELGPLSSEHVRAMIAAGSDTALDPAVVQRVDANADGVPLFVEEMLKMLELGSETAAADGAMSPTVVPPTLQGLLTERLDRLPELGDVIDAAAVLGREFDRDQLAALEPQHGADLGPALEQLAAHDVLRLIDDAGSRCEFTHGLLQEAAYQRLLRRRRHALHGSVAEMLTRRFGSVAEREPEVVAHHWSCAAQPGKAVPYWHAAGIRALERAAFLEAAEHFRRGFAALDATGPDPGDDLERVDFLTHLAASLQAGRGYAAARVDDTYAKARTACERAGSHERLVPVIRGQWMFHLLRAQYGTALDLGKEMLALGERDEDPVHLAEGHLYCGLVHMYLGNLELARERLEEAFTRYQQHDPSDQVYGAQGDTGVGALAYLALVLWNLGHSEESRQRSDLSLGLAEQVGGPVTRAQAWGMRSVLHLSRSEPAEVRHWLEKTLAHSVDHNVGYWQTLGSLFSGWLEGHAEDLQSGTTRLRDSLEAYMSSGSRLSLPHFYILLADLRLAAGDRRATLDALSAAEEHIETTGERFSESELFRVKGRALMAGDSPDPHGATAAYERAVEAARVQNAKLLELRAATRLVVHQRRLGMPSTAHQTVASLCDWFTPASQLPDVVRARALVAGEPATG